MISVHDHCHSRIRMTARHGCHGKGMIVYLIQEIGCRRAGVVDSAAVEEEDVSVVATAEEIGDTNGARNNHVNGGDHLPHCRPGHHILQHHDHAHRA